MPKTWDSPKWQNFAKSGHSGRTEAVSFDQNAGRQKIRVLVGGPHVPPFSLSIYLYSQQKTNLYFKRNSRTEAVWPDENCQMSIKAAQKCFH